MVKVEDLYSEFVDATQKSKYVFNAADVGMTRECMVAFFDKVMSDDRMNINSTMAIDLTLNRLGTALASDFEVVLKCIKKHDRLMVRFGFEVSVSDLEKALVATETEKLFDKRVFLDSPWTDDLRRRVGSLQSAIEGKFKDRQQFESDMKNWMHTESAFIERQATLAISSLVENARIIQEQKYVFTAHSGGDVDGLVAGTFHGEDVLIAIEAKHVIQSASVIKKTTDELLNFHSYWNKLCSLSTESEKFTKYQTDYQNLQVGQYKAYSLVFAIAAGDISDNAVLKFNKRFTRWIQLSLKHDEVYKVVGCHGNDHGPTDVKDKKR